MAVCKKCGCAIPIGSKTCDMCAAVGAVAPVGQPKVWQAPTNAAGPTELASSAASWAAAAGAARPALPTDLKKAEKKVREAWQFIAAIGVLNIGSRPAADDGLGSNARGLILVSRRRRSLPACREGRTTRAAPGR